MRNLLRLLDPNDVTCYEGLFLKYSHENAEEAGEDREKKSDV